MMKALTPTQRDATKWRSFITVPAYPWLFCWDILHQQRRYTAQQLTSILKRKGFTIEHVSYLQFISDYFRSTFAEINLEIA